MKNDIKIGEYFLSRRQITDNGIFEKNMIYKVTSIVKTNYNKTVFEKRVSVPEITIDTSNEFSFEIFFNDAWYLSIESRFFKEIFYTGKYLLIEKIIK